MNNTFIYNYLDQKGVKHSNKGFKYLMDLLLFIAENPEKNVRISDYYDEIGKKYNVKPVNVERAIRYSISGLGKTNKEFILKIVDDFLYGSNKV